MDSLFNVNGLMFWTEREFRMREAMRDYFVREMTHALLSINPMWRILMVEAPLLMPSHLVNPNYTNDDIFSLGDLTLRPETTQGSYQYIRDLLDDTNSGIRPPVCVWQAGKSFRREQDQPQKMMRLKEFYQLEFQCVFTDDTANDYHESLLKPTARMISEMVGLPTRIVDSDRLPSYSKKTRDVEVDNGDKWMEVCSMSLRTDFPGTAKFQGKKGVVERGLLVAEIAIGLDRCVYNWVQRTENKAI